MRITRDTDADIGIIFEDGDSEQLMRVMTTCAIPALQLFANKNRGYKKPKGFNYSLGLKGEFCEVFRKTGKLHLGIWDGDPDAFKDEPLREVASDMIGHLLLLLDASYSEGV